MRNASDSAGLALTLRLSSHRPRLTSTERVWKPWRVWYDSVDSAGCITSSYRSQNALLDRSTKLMCPWIHHWCRIRSVSSSSLATSSESLRAS